MTDAQSSFGTLIKIGDGGDPEVFTTIAEVKDISGPELIRLMETVTHHLSPGGFREQIPTTKEVGPITFPVNWLPQNATHSFTAGLLQDYDDGTLRNFKIVVPDVGATEWTLPCIVAGFGPDFPVTGVLGSEISLEVARQPTLA